MNKKRLVKKTILGFLMGASLVISVLLYRGDLQRLVRFWFQEKLVKDLITRLNKELPFEIEDIQIDTDWESLKQGRLSRVKVKLKKDPVHIVLDGPLQISNHVLSYLPETRVEGIPGAKPLQTILDLKVGLENQYQTIQSASLQFKVPRHEWLFSNLKLETEDSLVGFKWAPTTAELKVTLSKGQLSQSEDHTAILQGLQLSLKTSLQIQPFEFKPVFESQFSAKHLEALWGSLYIDQKLEPYHATATTERLEIHDKKSLLFSLKRYPDRRKVQISLPATPLRELWKTVSKMHPSLSKLEGIDVRAGTVQTEIDFNTANQNFKSDFQIKKLDAIWAENDLAVKDLNLKISDLTQLGFSKASVNANKIVFKKFHAELRESPLSLQKVDEGIQVSLGDKEWLDLKFENLPLQIGRLHGLIDGDETEIFSKAILEPVDLTSVLKPLCINLKNLPPTPVEFNFESWSFSSDFIDITGKVTARQFEGTIEVDELGIFDLSSPVSEVDFSARWKGLRLDKIGEFVGFGKMDGTLEGYAEDVVFQSWLPTQFDLKSEVKPQHSRMIVFSPDAMKNVVRLFAGDDLEQMPGVAQWIAFGWPSRVLGGYDVHYAGISAFSREGSILLETLDPKKVWDRERKHFFLYGPRFKMPLNSQRYPLVVDATAMMNFIRRLKDQLEQIAVEKRMKEGQPMVDERIQNENTYCFDPGF